MAALFFCRQKFDDSTGKVLLVTFTDSGKGVPEDVQSQIFDSFLSRGIKAQV